MIRETFRSVPLSHNIKHGNEFHEGAGPAMEEEDRYGVSALREKSNEMDIKLS
jgi:hypothetical protein